MYAQVSAHHLRISIRAPLWSLHVRSLITLFIGSHHCWGHYPEIPGKNEAAVFRGTRHATNLIGEIHDRYGSKTASGCLLVRVCGRFRLYGDDVVEHPDSAGVAFVVVVLLELVFGDAFGDRGVYEGVVTDENADVADAVAAGLEEDEIAGFELTALDLLPETCHFLGCAREFHTENPVVHEAHKT